MKNKFTICLVVFLAFILSGCATGNLKNPFPQKVIREMSESGKCSVIVSKQGVIPTDRIYRANWPDAPIATEVTKDGKRAIPIELILPVIGQAIEAAGTAGSDYNKTQQNTYRYRTDIGVFNVTNLDSEILHEILSYGTRPSVDADRPAYRQTEENEASPE